MVIIKPHLGGECVLARGGNEDDAVATLRCMCGYAIGNRLCICMCMHVIVYVYVHVFRIAGMSVQMCVLVSTSVCWF